MLVNFEIEVPDNLIEKVREIVSKDDKEEAKTFTDTYIIEPIHETFTGEQDYIKSNVIVWQHPEGTSQGLTVCLSDCDKEDRAHTCDLFIKSIELVYERILDMLEILDDNEEKKEEYVRNGLMVIDDSIMNLIHMYEELEGSNETINESLYSIRESVDKMIRKLA